MKLKKLATAWMILAKECESEIARAKDPDSRLTLSDDEIIRYEQAGITYKFCADNLTKAIEEMDAPRKPYTHRTCEDCGLLVDLETNHGHKKGCDYVWGRRGWRQLGAYDG